jgi:hypothetical protein
MMKNDKMALDLQETTGYDNVLNVITLMLVGQQCKDINPLRYLVECSRFRVHRMHPRLHCVKCSRVRVLRIKTITVTHSGILSMADYLLLFIPFGEPSFPKNRLGLTIIYLPNDIRYNLSKQVQDNFLCFKKFTITL